MTFYWPNELVRLIITYLPIQLKLLILGNCCIKLKVEYDHSCTEMYHERTFAHSIVEVVNQTIFFVPFVYGEFDDDLDYCTKREVSPDEDLFERMKACDRVCRCRIKLFKSQLETITDQKLTYQWVAPGIK
jgi:hypothetical protein